MGSQNPGNALLIPVLAQRTWGWTRRAWVLGTWPVGRPWGWGWGRWGRGLDPDGVRFADVAGCDDFEFEDANVADGDFAAFSLFLAGDGARAPEELVVAIDGEGDLRSGGG